MKNLCFTLIFVALTTPALFGQQTPKSDNRSFDYGDGGDTESNIIYVERPFHRFNFKFYPFSLLTNVRAELGINMNPKLQVNILAANYYNIGTAEDDFPFSMFYTIPVEGQEVQLSVEHTVREGSLRIGGRVGLLGYTSEEDPYENYDGETVSVHRKQNQLSVQFLMRWRQEFGSRFFIEETLGFGVWYKNRAETTTILAPQVGALPIENTVYTDFYTPIARFGINIGFDFYR